MNSERPKRRFWQIHLSTPIVLILFSASFLWANARVVLNGYDGHVIDHTGEGNFGWPFTVGYRERELVFDWNGPRDERMNEYYRSLPIKTIWYAKPLVLNTALGIFFLVSVALVLEYLISYRDRQRAAKAAESALPRE